MKKVAISQSNYIPWKGYFDNIACVDEFILYDDMQYTKRDWRNRNKIKTPKGLKWLTIPVEVKGKFYQKINETNISDQLWFKKHINLLKQNYSNAKHYNSMLTYIEETYNKASKLDNLSEINNIFIKRICSFLNIKTKITLSSEYKVFGGNPTDQLVNICLQTGATDYYTGSAAKNYIDELSFKEKGINIHYFDYSGYIEYEQLHGEFDHGVSILDLMFNEGKSANKFLKYCTDE